ncbi:hypothetical protein NPIL_223221 [Nephila pilipes]|uniref:Uncharacterized protein n=1 Tax=Nephila pilipes TaxID=299642 RepID=A0A8X6IQJ5_NEPPI|nr:hypothetical protein NPIL_223221 [Nephila pilipes]
MKSAFSTVEYFISKQNRNAYFLRFMRAKYFFCDPFSALTSYPSVIPPKTNNMSRILSQIGKRIPFSPMSCRIRFLGLIHGPINGSFNGSSMAKTCSLTDKRSLSFCSLREGISERKLLKERLLRMKAMGYENTSSPNRLAFGPRRTRHLNFE